MTGRRDLTLLERTKIQAEVLVPLIKALESELGTEPAHALVRRTLGARVRESVRAATPPGGERAAVEWALTTSKAGDAQEHERLDGLAGELNLDVTRCGFADFFAELDEPDLGFLLVCSLDHDIVDGLDGVTLDRTQTIMQGSDHCDFRFKIDERSP
ncbi:MAG: L-2-amino-thiazoline-4-carboxylic acid hydrolase [Actinomycetota bacterium]